MAKSENKIRADYTEGSITGSVIKMGLPSMVGFMTQHIYHFINMYWISRLPEKESGVAAITFFGSIMWFLFTFNQLVGSGSVAIISRRYGEKNYDQAEKAIKESIVLKLAFGAVLGVVGYLFSAPMLAAIGASGRVLEMGVEYADIMFLGMPAMYSIYTIFTAMRGVANPNLALGLMLLVNVLNMIFDPLLIFGYCGLPAMGMRGAAFASVLSCAITFLLGLILFYTDAVNVRLSLFGKEPITIPSMWRMLSIGFPSWVGDISFSGARMILTGLVAPFGTAVVAAYGVGNQITAFGIAILTGIGLGLSALIGQTLGGEKKDRAKKIGDKAIQLSIWIMLIFGLLAFVFAGNIIGLFFNSPETIESGRIMLRIMAIGFPFIGILIMLGQIHGGVGLNSPAMIFNIINAWIFEVIPVYFLTKFWGFSEITIWWMISGAAAAVSIMFYIYYRRGRWLHHKV